MVEHSIFRASLRGDWGIDRLIQCSRQMHIYESLLRVLPQWYQPNRWRYALTKQVKPQFFLRSPLFVRSGTELIAIPRWVYLWGLKNLHQVLYKVDGRSAKGRYRRQATYPSSSSGSVNILVLCNQPLNLWEISKGFQENANVVGNTERRLTIRQICLALNSVCSWLELISAMDELYWGKVQFSAQTNSAW